MHLERVMKRTILSTLVLGPALLLAALVAPATVAAADPCASITGANVTFDLWAKTGTLSLPGATVPIWGYSTTSGGTPSVPGQQLVVNQCDQVTVNLTNNLSQPTAVLFDGQSMIPDTTGIAAGGTGQYQFKASQPGTYLYEAGMIPGSQYQAALGLHGALVVRPYGAPTRAYPDASTAFGDEAVVVLEDIDPALHNSATPWTFDLRAYAPTYFLVNGRAWTSATPTIATTAGNQLLLREINAGVRHHSLATLGVRQSVIAADGSQLPAPRSVAAETLAPGQSADALVAIPVTTAPSTKYALYDGALALSNGSANGIGGMIAFIDAAPAGPNVDVVGPTTSALALTETAPGSGLFTVTAHESDVATGNATVAAAEYRIDSSVGVPVGLTAVDTTFDEPEEDVTSSLGEIDTTAWTSGNHTVYVRGQDGLGNWGPMVSATIVIDRAGPATTGLTLNPNPSNGTGTIALGGSASDVATGNNNVTAAEYFLGGTGADGTGTNVSLNKLASTVSLSATIPGQASSTVVWVHARDALGNWGAFASIALTVDAAGPATSSLSAAPPANNGSYGFNSSSPFVRVTATVSDTATGNANVSAAEGFIDGLTWPDGTGFPFLPVDGTFNSSSEVVYSEIPLSTINLLTSGGHTIRVHGKDAAGNWGTSVLLPYLIDRTAPTFSGISVAPSPTYDATTVTLTVNGSSDPLAGSPPAASGVAGGEWWIGTTAPAAGGGTAFSGITASVPVGTLATGTYTIGARIRDAAGNWSTGANGVRTTTFQVLPNTILVNGFETGTNFTNWGWSSKSTANNAAGTARLTVTAGSAAEGTRKLQAQGNNTNYVQYNLGTAAQPTTATYDVRFRFNPNGNASSGQDIFLAASSTTFTTQRFHVRYRQSVGQAQVQVQLGATGNATWVNIANTGYTSLEATWQSGGSLQLYVNGSLAQTIGGASGSIGAVRLGSVTSGGNSTLMFFDAFASKRLLTPLYGP
jgi:hypothetical protein